MKQLADIFYDQQRELDRRTCKKKREREYGNYIQLVEEAKNTKLAPASQMWEKYFGL